MAAYRAKTACFAGFPANAGVAYLLLPEYRQRRSSKTASRKLLARKDTLMISRERVESVLQRIRPFMQADGGDIQLLTVEGNTARVRLTGMCAGCPSAHMTLYLGVESALREEIREFERLELV
jgi:Fe-S cluster biogenesis protein NfuA